MASTTVRRKNVTMRSLSGSQIEEWATEGVPFKASEMSGHVGSFDAGRLDSEWRELYRQQVANGSVIYTVVSFATPIAWRLRRGWVLTDQTWGNRTARHQSIARGLRPMAAGSMWCGGSDRTVTPVAREQRSHGAKGHEGICPECGEKLAAPNGKLAAHVPGVKHPRIR